jgi:uncharacterized protein YukE
VGVLDAFESTWSNARSTFGQGTSQEGAQFDNSAQLRQMQSSVEAAKPGERWTGSASDTYASANEKQARVLGQVADLDQRLRTEVDRSAAVVAVGRRDLDAVRRWVHDAAATVPPGHNRDRMLYPIVSRGSGEIAEIVQRANGELNTIAGRIGGLKGEYQALGGNPTENVPRAPVDHAWGDQQEPWKYPWEPPPPPDSAPGGGRWDISGPGYESGPGGGPPMGPVIPPKPWHKDFDPPVAGGPSGFQEVVAPPPNGWGVQPGWTLEEGYRFRVVGEGFNGAADHVRWVQRDGKWYQATWVDYAFEAEHQYRLVPHNSAGGYMSPSWGAGEWSPIDIKDIYKIQVDNPRLPLYIPNPFGGAHELPVGRPVIVPGG